MGLFDKLFNDDEKEKQEAARRKAAEKYAEEHNNSHAEEHDHAPAKKTAAKAAEKPVAKKAPAKTVTAKAVPAKKTATVPRQVAPHLHTAEAPNHTHAASSAAAATAAHDQAMTLHILSHIPDHSPREDDPHYHLFEQAKARLKRQKLWKCIINDDLCDGEPELHHSYIEFSQINQVDPKKIQEALGLHFDNDEDFQVWAESPGNLEVLCVAHHRAHYGIHMIPGPLWEAVRFHKKGTEAAAEFLPASEAN
ncbi:hypothetical protein [Actinocrinis sp.]|uniref:hypothetical protein n=1 Tax=Actinocrinis sp. TaxID=1920516 RepID=UPI002D44DF34|nr:hypothetical protein [Actinocrinis sp.]HZP52277.1 hypothetical protein [Actinocrinis sp.]